MHTKINPEHVTLIYTDTNNEKHTQPVNYLVEAGTMMNPDTGEELSLQHVLVAGDNTRYDPIDVTIVYVDEHNNEHTQPVYDAVVVGTMLSDYTGDTMPIDHIEI